MSNRVLVYRIGSQPKMKAVAFWTSPSVTAVEVSDAIRSFSESEGPVAEVCLITWHHCSSLFDELLVKPLDLRVDSTGISGAILNRDLKWRTQNVPNPRMVLKEGYEFLFRKRGGVLVAPDGYHYQKLSGVHSQKFLRAANVFINSNESALFALGVLVELAISAPPDIIYTDTSAINVVGHLISDFFLTGEGPSPIPVVSFSSYEGLESGFVFDFAETAIVVMSATTSGSLERKLVKEHEIREKRICTLFAANELKGPQVLFNISESEGEPFGEIENYQPGSCPLCDRQQPVITISGDQFLPEPATCRAFELLRKDLSAASLRFVNDIENGKVKCHALMQDGSRRLFHFDLFGNPSCQVEVEVKRQFGLLFGKRGMNVLVPPHTENLGWTSGDDYQVRCTENFSDVQDQPFLGVFCPVNYGSGETASLALGLRQIPNDPARSFLLGVSIYSGSEEQKETISSLEFRKAGWKYLVNTVYELHLPSLRNGKTPWDIELAWLDLWRGAWKDLSQVNERYIKLRDSRWLDANDIFLPDFSGETPGATKGFAFFNDETVVGDQSRILLTVALALHDRRRMKKSWSMPQNREVVEPRMFNRYSDPAIQAAFLRGALSEELNYSGDQHLSSRFAQIVDAMIAGEGVGYAAALSEFCYAVLSDRVHLDGHVRHEMIKKIANMNASNDWAKCFVEIAKVQLS